MSNPETQISTPGASEPARAWVAAFTEGWRAPASAAEFVAHFREILASDIRLIQPQMPPTVGIDAFARDFVAPLFALIDGIHADVERWAASGETIYIELTLRGTIGGRPFSARACDRVRLAPDGRAAERETYFDPTPLLGAVARSPRAWPLFLSLRVPRKGAPAPAPTTPRKEPTMKEIKIPQGTIRYRDEGSGDPIVFVHGFLVDGELWRDVAARLAPDFRVIAPDWPMGSHQIPFGPGADLSPPGVARIVAAFLEALGLENVTLVGNDSGGAICQIVAVEHPQRVARLVLTSCDAYDNFPPPAFRPLQALARVPGAVGLILQTMRSAFSRRTPTAYGWVMKRADDALTGRWVAPALHDRGVRHDATEFLRGMRRQYTLAAAKRFGEFNKPVLIAWAREDRFFKVRYAERLAADFPAARLEFIDDAYAFVSLDQPERTAELIGAFAREPQAQAANSTLTA